jgi:tetratricopeptide (TPR) repeat protein
MPSAGSVIRAVLAVDPEGLAIPALTVATETDEGVADLLVETIESVHISKPVLARIASRASHPSGQLPVAAAGAFKQLANGSSDDGERVTLLSAVSERLAEIGRYDEGLAAAEEAVAICRKLDNRDSRTFLVALARSLRCNAVCLSALGRWDEVLMVVDEAVAIWRRGADSKDGHESLAVSLGDKTVCLSALGRWDEALMVVDEAVAIWRRGADSKDGHESLAVSLGDTTVCLSALGRWDEALTVVDEAVAICRMLASKYPDRPPRCFAYVLETYSKVVANLGLNEAARTAMDEAAAIRDRLAARRSALRARRKRTIS